MSYGRILAAGIEIDGDELQSDHSATDTVLDVEHALDFFEPEYGETIQVRIVAEDGTEELATIKVPETEDEDTVDDEEGFITLASGLVNSYPAGSRVEVYPKTQRLVAQVRLDDAEEDTETIDAVVHHTLYDRIPEGVDLDIAVEMDYDGETYYVVNVLGEPPQVDGGFLSPGTVDYPALADQVGSIRIVDSEAALANLDAKPGDAAFVRGEAGLYKYMDQQPSVTTYDAEGDPVLTPIVPVAGTTNWYRTTDAADILANSITATHIQVETLDAISANLGEVTAGTITGVLIRTGTSGGRIELDSQSDPDRIKFHHTSGPDVAAISLSADGSNLVLEADADVVIDSNTRTTSRVVIGETFDQAGNHLRIRNVADNATVQNPPAGYVAIFYNSVLKQVIAKNSNGDVRGMHTAFP